MLRANHTFVSMATILQGLCPTLRFLNTHKLYLKSVSVQNATCQSCTFSPAHFIPYTDLLIIIRNARLLYGAAGKLVLGSPPAAEGATIKV